MADKIINIDYTVTGNDPPVITNLTTEEDNVGHRKTAIVWQPNCTTEGAPDVDFKIIDAIFYDSQADKTASNPTRSTLFEAGTKNADGSYTVPLNESVTVSSETDFVYSLEYSDDRIDDPAWWDPTIKVKPRGGTAPPPQEGEAGAGG